ncbi:putative membrane protein [Hymenobacter daecheongensis DSM 21074]|uniref:Putative membrane protein n=1 Tax=Hymenobacter daecheongensis DSM 21074 TaxID=1121955 RepID=A0A1M6D4V0_9BACT|nr:bestrophin family ion channel [Hymenobacter daecheongensis]SHI68287.1 putative membrane protein [Hymenobacter daecheongensis DSM 21074]
MYLRNNLRWQLIFEHSWRSLLIFAAWSALVCLTYGPLGLHSVSIPWQPVGTLGIAVSFYIGFKNNGSYDRFLDARQIWGGIVNNSRTWAMQVLELITSQVSSPDVDGPAATAAELSQRHRSLIYRQIAWCNALRLRLRRQPELWDAEVAPFLTAAEAALMRTRQNPPTHLLREQAAELRRLREERGLLNDFQHVSMMRTLEQLYELQGGCERIKNTPFPRQYAFFSYVFVWLFIALLPLGLIGEFADMGPDHIWLTVPFSMLVSWVFNTIEVVGHTSENPFENQMNDVAMTALCRTIEIDLREMLGETDLPPALKPVNDILY